MVAEKKDRTDLPYNRSIARQHRSTPKRLFLTGGILLGPFPFIFSLLQVYVFFTSSFFTFIWPYKIVNNFLAIFLPLGNFTFFSLSFFLTLLYFVVVYVDAWKKVNTNILPH